MTSNKKPKLAPARAWAERDIADWNTTTFHAYLTDKHTEIFGCDYAPFPNFIAEKSVIGSLIGTSGKNAKPRTATNVDVKSFIDECFASCVPNSDYPGTSFGFSWKYRANVWQRIQVEAKAQARRAEAVEASDIDEVADWFAK